MNPTTTTKKSSRFGSLGKLFFEEEPETPSQAITEQVAAVPMPQLGATYISGNSRPQVDPKIKESLKAALEENALGSYDYLKFKKSADALRSVVPDEASRFKASFVAAQTLSVSKEKLVETANHYLTVLGEEQRKFNEAIEGANKGKIVSGMQRLAQIESIVTEKAAAIQKLTAEITELQKEKAETEAKVNEDKLKIDTTTAGFNAAYELFVQEIKSDINKMQTYL